MLTIFKMKKMCSISLLVMSFSSLSYASIDSSHSIDQQHAIQGDVEAQFQMGQQYHVQDVQHPDVELQKKSFEWYKKAADQGNQEASNRIGRLVMNGKIDDTGITIYSTQETGLTLGDIENSLNN